MFAEKISEAVELKKQILSDKELLDRLQAAADCLVRCLKKGRHVYFCGNGGSAADAQHLAAELSGRFYIDRPSLPSEALHCNTSYLTAVANDYGYDLVYARLLSGIGAEGDVLVGISTSGNSENIVKAYEVAKQKGLEIISLTGKTGGKMAALSDYLLNVPSTDTPRIQEIHILFGHLMCEYVEKQLFQQ